MANNIFTSDGYGRDQSSDFHTTRGDFCHPVFKTELSLSARAILLLMHHHPWLLSFTLTDISAHCDPGCDPEIGVRRALKELEDRQYIFRNARGRFEVTRIARDLINALNKTKRGGK